MLTALMGPIPRKATRSSYVPVLSSWMTSTASFFIPGLELRRRDGVGARAAMLRVPVSASSLTWMASWAATPTVASTGSIRASPTRLRRWRRQNPRRQHPAMATVTARTTSLEGNGNGNSLVRDSMASAAHCALPRIWAFTAAISSQAAPDAVVMRAFAAATWGSAQSAAAPQAAATLLRAVVLHSAAALQAASTRVTMVLRAAAPHSAIELPASPRLATATSICAERLAAAAFACANASPRSAGIDGKLSTSSWRKVASTASLPPTPATPSKSAVAAPSK
mmetsp:Transcript_93712/g.190781  ORF Transcript_93712/g.190781 Transcript_93712/m.190781 type:complete len:281 (+) Transcript_93712:166-1008(+)